METGVNWLREAKWGVMCHYLAVPASSSGGEEVSAEEWNRRVDQFDTIGLSEQLANVGANYFLITIGQNSGNFCAPNSTYDSLVGIVPSKCSKRDLISDLYEALNPKGIKLMVYLPSGAPAADPVAVKNLEWEWGYQGGWPQSHEGERTGKRLMEFQLKWEAIVKEWSIRWGTKIAGWWIDGCYFSDEMYRYPDEPNFKSFTNALKAGNVESIVAYNPGVMVPIISHTEHEDYTAGEISTVFPICPGEILDGAQYHVLSYLGNTWGEGDPRFCDEFVLGYTTDVVKKGGVVTWDVPISEQGLLPEPMMKQLSVLGSSI